MREEDIKNICWWIPNRKLRDSVRNYLYAISDIQNKIDYSIIRSDNIEKSVFAVNNILNSYIDITRLPKAKGRIREKQLKSLELLKWMDEVCQKYNIDYWLFGGTLLGAVRHKGFVPWDDDIDLGVMRKDFKYLRECMEKERSSCNFKINIMYYLLDCYVITIREGIDNDDDFSDKSIHMDIFVFDVFTENSENKYFKNNMIECLNEIKYIYQEEMKYGWEFKKYSDDDLEYLSSFMENKIYEKTKTLPTDIKNDSTIFRIVTITGYSEQFYNYTDIFPLIRLDFDIVCVGGGDFYLLITVKNIYNYYMVIICKCQRGHIITKNKQ